MLIWYSKHQPKPSCSNGCAALSPSPGAAQAGVSDTMHYNQASFVPLLFLKNLYIVLSKGQTTELLLLSSFGLKSCRKQGCFSSLTLNLLSSSFLSINAKYFYPHNKNYLAVYIEN